MTEPPSSVTTWVERLRAGDPAAAEPLWQRYYARLVSLARDHLALRARAAADEEDVALNAFADFCSGAATGRFPSLNDRDALWRLLFTLTVRRARDHGRRAGRQKRGGGDTIPEGDLFTPGEGDLDAFPGREPDPAWAAEVADELAHRFAALPGDDLRRVARDQLAGYTAAEIARREGCSLRTVERKWQVVRRFWLEHADG